MDSQQVDLDSNIHRGMRNLLSGFSLQAGATDGTEPGAVAKLSNEFGPFNWIGRKPTIRIGYIPPDGGSALGVAVVCL